MTDIKSNMSKFLGDKFVAANPNNPRSRLMKEKFKK